jgi:UDP-N-acetylmuramate: L-alanyl-gamma-D-glutamyl-meso-diaminopimelate ligase
VPGEGRLIVNGSDENLARVLRQGCWSEVEYFGVDINCDWTLQPNANGFEVLSRGVSQGVAKLRMPGAHNRANALVAIAAAAHAGVAVSDSLAALAQFSGVKRRLEWRGERRGVAVYDDFAHHPTAIEATLSALREPAATPTGRILAVLEPRSNTMRLGGHAETLAASLQLADAVFVYARPDLKWDAQAALGSLGAKLHTHADLETLVADVVAQAQAGDCILVMSNGDFGGVHDKLLAALSVV